MSFADSAELLLRESGKALKYSELADQAISKKLLTTESQNPRVTMYISLRNEIKRHDERQEKQRFVFLGKGLFDLADRSISAAAKKTRSALDQIRESRDEAKRELFATLTSGNNGDNFEAMVADLLIAMGYKDVQVIGGKDDQGVDILCTKRDGIALTRYAVQCKCKKLSQKIGPKDISNLRDNISSYQCQQGVFVTTSVLNDVAKKKATEAGKEPIQTIEHDEILELFAEYGIGIKHEAIRYYQVDSAQYDFLVKKTPKGQPSA